LRAVDGLELKLSTEQDRRIFGPGLRYSQGAKGCALSHLNFWDSVIQSKLPATIAEDDAVFREDFAEKSSELIASLPAGRDNILWGWNFDSILSVNEMCGVSQAVMLFDQDKLRQSVRDFKKLERPAYPLRLDKCFGTPAYTISPEGATRFKTMCFPLENFELNFPLLDVAIKNNGIDISMNRCYSKTNSFVSFPPLVITKNEHEISTVQGSLTKK